MPNNTPAVLLLEDGTSYQGFACGKIGTATGEICFNTSMTGYQELFTDPSYFGQLLISTNVHVGNYGVIESEAQSNNIQIAGLICRDYANNYSRKQANSSLEDYFIQHNLVGISGIDTRAVVRYVRKKGAMNAIISSEITDIEILKQELHKVPNMEGLELGTKVTTKEAYTVGNPDATYKVAALDLGIKKSILNNLANRDWFVKVFPATTSFDEMKAFNPNGYFISNGPGDPSAMDYALETVKQILAADMPLFGICMGHQLLARAADIPTYKLHHGHRGGNHPVKNLKTGNCEITAQNHGFAVDMEALQKSDKARLTHINLNDNSVEGLEIIGKKAFSVQYHPEAAPGPHDSHILFEDFVKMMS